MISAFILATVAFLVAGSAADSIAYDPCALDCECYEIGSFVTL